LPAADHDPTLHKQQAKANRRYHQENPLKLTRGGGSQETFATFATAAFVDAPYTWLGKAVDKVIW